MELVWLMDTILYYYRRIVSFSLDSCLLLTCLLQIINTPRGAVESLKDMFEVFYIDFGNQEAVPYSRLRPVDPSMSSAPGLAQLCSLAHIKVPSLDEDFGQEAAEYLSDYMLNGAKEFVATIEEKDTSGGKVKGQGTGNILIVTLVAVGSELSLNALMLQVRIIAMFLSLISCYISFQLSVTILFPKVT